MKILKFEINKTGMFDAHQSMLELEQNLGVKLHKEQDSDVIHGQLETEDLENGKIIFNVSLYEQADVDFINALPDSKKASGVIYTVANI